jgi:hypothetical protein
MPTKVPTTAPTAYCPVTCEVDDKNKNWGNVYGYGAAFGQGSFFKQAATHAHLARCDTLYPGAPQHGCNWHNRKTKRLVATHNVELINEQDTYRKHRCYHFNGTCMCECLEKTTSFPKFQDGTVQGKANGLQGEADGGTDPFSDLLELQQGHRGAMHDQELHDKQAKMKSGNVWANPNKVPFKAEAEAIKTCCSTLATSTLAIPFWGHTCADVQAFSDAELRGYIQSFGSFNTLQGVLVQWLQAHDCFHHYHQ